MPNRIFVVVGLWWIERRASRWCLVKLTVGFILALPNTVTASEKALLNWEAGSELASCWSPARNGHWSSRGVSPLLSLGSVTWYLRFVSRSWFRVVCGLWIKVPSLSGAQFDSLPKMVRCMILRALVPMLSTSRMTWKYPGPLVIGTQIGRENRVCKEPYFAERYWGSQTNRKVRHTQV